MWLKAKGFVDRVRQ